jgi:hypothetical protein
MPAQYLPTVAWETIVRDVVVADATHYYVSVYPENPNDPGSDLLSATVGQYLKDWIGHTYKIVEVNVGGVPLRLRVEDSFLTGVGPQQGLTGIVYKSPSGSPFLAPIRHFRLDDSALDYSRAIELDVLWTHRGFKAYSSDTDQLNITRINLGDGVKYSNYLPNGGWDGGGAVTLGLINRYTSSGCLDDDSFTDNGNGTLTIPTKRYSLYSNAEGYGYSLEYPVIGNTFTPTDNAYSYIVVNYNSGSPILQLISDVNLINETTVIPVMSIYRNGNLLHTTPWDTLGNAKVDKLHQSIIKTQRYRRESGVIISVVPTKKISITAGVMWIGAVKRVINQYTQGDAGGTTLSLTKVAGVWTPTSAVSFDNTKYQNGENVATLTSNRYCVLFVYRGVETNKHIYYVYGTGDYTEAEAKASVVPSDLPLIITSHTILVGRIISQKGSTTPLEVASAFDTVFATQISSGGAPGGDNPQLQYNNNGTFGGIPGLTYDNANGIIGQGIPFKKLSVTYTADASLYTGNVTTNDASSFYYNTASFTPNAFVGKVVVIGSEVFTVSSNTSNRIYPSVALNANYYNGLSSTVVTPIVLTNSDYGKIISIVSSYICAIKLPLISSTYDRCEIDINIDTIGNKTASIYTSGSDYLVGNIANGKVYLFGSYFLYLKILAHNTASPHWDKAVEVNMSNP